MRQSVKAALFALTAAFGLAAASADDATVVKLSLKDHKFSPAEATAPVGKPFRLEVTNLDPTPAEFESKPLRIEKLVPAGGAITVPVRALPAGRYRFFDDYHEDAAHGFLVAQ